MWQAPCQVDRQKNIKLRIPLCCLAEWNFSRRGGYYNWLKRKDEPDKDEVIADLMAECHEKSHITYGYRRVKTWLLRETGLVINHKAVLRIMRKYEAKRKVGNRYFLHTDKARLPIFVHDQ